MSQGLIWPNTYEAQFVKGNNSPFAADRPLVGAGSSIVVQYPDFVSL